MAASLEVVQPLEQLLLSAVLLDVEGLPPAGVMSPLEVASVSKADPPLEVVSPVAESPPLELVGGELVEGAERDLALLIEVEVWSVAGAWCVRYSF